MYRRRAKFPSAEGWRALRDGVVIVPHPRPGTTHANYVCAGPGGCGGHSGVVVPGGSGLFGDLLTHAVWIIYVRGLFG